MTSLHILDLPIIGTSFLVAWLESLLSFITSILPEFVIVFFTNTTTLIYKWFTKVPSFYSGGNKYVALLEHPDLTDEKYERMLSMLNSRSIHDQFGIFDYEIEDRIVKTKDGYLLTVHHIISGPSTLRKPNGKVVYLHHGLLMNSEVWITMIDKQKNLPLVLYDLGYDVWLGNNRGNKYSQKHISHKLKSEEFWDFSLDEFALFDIPNTIDYILEFTAKEKLTYIGFSQGTAQAFGAVALNIDLNNKIDQIIAISPATTPHGLYSKFLDILFKSSPNFVFLLFSTKVLLPSTIFWQSIIYPPLFITIIDFCNNTLFNWKSHHISYFQKVALYAHLYSTTSVKTVAHWFQIMASRKFQMYHDNYTSLSGLQTITYPLKSIKVPILLIYGTIDSLVDIRVMQDQLPAETTTIRPVEDHEHLDNLWGEDVEDKVFKYVLGYMGITQTIPQLKDREEDSIKTFTPRKITYTIEEETTFLENFGKNVTFQTPPGSLGEDA